MFKLKKVYSYTSNTPIVYSEYLTNTKHRNTLYMFIYVKSPLGHSGRGLTAPVAFYNLRIYVYTERKVARKKTKQNYTENTGLR